MTAIASTMSSAFFGSAAQGPTITGAPLPASAGTEGIFGRGGQFNLDVLLENGLNMGTAAFQLFSGNQAADFALQKSRQEARALELQSQEDLLQAQQEEIKGKQDTNQIMEGLLRTVAAQRLAFAANGVDPNFGTPKNIADETKKLADLQMSTTRTDATIRSLSRRRQSAARLVEAGNTRIAGQQEADAARLGGYAKAGGTLAEAAIRRVNRG